MKNRKPSKEYFCKNGSISLEAEGHVDKSRNLYASMNNVLVYPRYYSGMEESVVIKLMTKEIQIKFPEDIFEIYSDSNDYYIAYVYSIGWKRSLGRKKFIPEIYAVPYKGRISVAYTGSGYLLRTSDNSGFRLKSADEVKSYLVDREYDLYNMSNNKKHPEWEDLYDCNHINMSWKEHQKTYKKIKLKTSKTVGNRNTLNNVFTVILYFAISITLFGIYDIKSKELEVVKTNESTLSRTIMDITGETMEYMSGYKESPKKDGSFLSMYFNKLLKFHSKDRFTITKDSIEVYPNVKENMGLLKNLNNVKVNYR